MQSKWVTIATFNMPYQAHLAKARLEAEDIPVTIHNEHISRLYQYAGALGGVQLQVLGEHIEEAKKILESVPDNELTDEEALSAKMPEEPGPRPPESIDCPQCGSEGFAEELNYPIERFLNGILLGLPYLWIGRPLHCRACDHTFRAQ